MEESPTIETEMEQRRQLLKLGLDLVKKEIMEEFRKCWTDIETNATQNVVEKKLLQRLPIYSKSSFKIFGNFQEVEPF